MRFDREFFGGAVAGFAVGVTMGAIAFAQVQEGLPPIVVTPFEAEIVGLDREAMRDAYKEQVGHLFLTWMKDSTGQPSRAARGVDQARRAYVEIMQRIEERERRVREVPLPRGRPP